MSVIATPESIEVRLDHQDMLALFDYLDDFEMTTDLGYVDGLSGNPATVLTIRPDSARELRAAAAQAGIHLGKWVTVSPEQFVVDQAANAAALAVSSEEIDRVRRALADLNACTVSVEEAAKLLGKTEDEVCHAALRGWLPSRHVGCAVLILRFACAPGGPPSISSPQDHPSVTRALLERCLRSGVPDELSHSEPPQGRPGDSDPF